MEVFLETIVAVSLNPGFKLSSETFGGFGDISKELSSRYLKIPALEFGVE